MKGAVLVVRYNELQQSYKKMDECLVSASEIIERLSHLHGDMIGLHDQKVESLERCLNLAQEQFAIFKSNYAKLRVDICIAKEAWQGPVDEFEPWYPPLERAHRTSTI